MNIKTLEERILDIIIYSLLTFFAIITIFPFLNMLALSLNEASDTYKGGITVFPRKFTLQNYMVVFDAINIGRYYFNTIFRAVVGTIFILFFNSITAYALSKRYIKIRRPVLAFLVFTTLFNGGIVPYYMVLGNLRLINNIWVYVLPATYGVFNILVFRTFFEGIPASLEESARIDGASEIRIMWNIILPISMPVFATIALFAGVNHWNDWFTGEFYINSKNNWTIQNYLLKVLHENEGSDTIDKVRRASDSRNINISPESVRMAVLMTVCLPIMCIYPFLQKYFIKGVLIGAIKG